MTELASSTHGSALNTVGMGACTNYNYFGHVGCVSSSVAPAIIRV